MLGPFCGTTIDPIIRSHSNRLYIKFKSDNSMSAKGFQIYYDSTASGKDSFSYGDGRDRMVVRFTTIYALSAYHHESWEFEPPN